MAKPSKGHGAKPAATAPAAEAQPAAAVDPAAGSAAGSGAADAAPAKDEDPFAKVPHIVGPKLVDLGHGAEINLPAGMILFEKATAQQLLKEGGNSVETTIAAVVKPGAKWLVVIDAEDVGYVNDDDAKDLDADALLKSFKEGTIEQNKERVAKGVPELFVDGWSEPLHYDKPTHHLLWGLNAHDKDSKSVNFFTRVLGRNGFLSVDLIDGADTITASKAEALAVLDSIRFKPGSSYAEHASGDKDSHMGLTALVAAGTGILIAKKTGLLVAFLLFMKKGVILVFAAVAGFFRKIFRRKKKDDAAPPLVGGMGNEMPGQSNQGYAPPSDFGAQPQQWPPPAAQQPQQWPPPAAQQQNYGQGGHAQHADNHPPQNNNGGWPPDGNGGNNNGNNGNNGGGWPQG
ncbi:MAG TPA: DUF2167 domain-containing protein [Kofleriaceae bacterium]